jgi:hypothetical protein
VRIAPVPRRGWIREVRPRCLAEAFCPPGSTVIARKPSPRSSLMSRLSAAGSARRGWSLTQADVLFCAMPIVFFLSVVSLL